MVWRLNDIQPFTVIHASTNAVAQMQQPRYTSLRCHGTSEFTLTMMGKDGVQHSIVIHVIQLGELTNDVMPDDGRPRQMVYQSFVLGGLPIPKQISILRFVIVHFTRIMEECRQVILPRVHLITEI